MRNGCESQNSKYSFIKEPEVIKQWRERQMEMLRKKDEEEENARNRLKDQAAQVTGEMLIVIW